MILLRYMSYEYGIKSIQDNRFKVLRPLDANDPYEMMGACKGELTAEVKCKMLADMRKKWLRAKESGAPEDKIGTFEDIERRVAKSESYYEKVIMERVTQQHLHRILCFVAADKIDSDSDQLMWAHYAGGGSGVRIWFESDKLITKWANMYAVKYSDTRPTIDLSSLSTYEIDDQWIPFLKAVLFTKSKAWEYEHEQRMLVSHRFAGSHIITENTLEFIHIPAEAILRVDFGPKGEIERTKESVINMRAIPSLSHIDFRVAEFDKSGYGYKYAAIDI